jgi:hypothetical protein
MTCSYQQVRRLQLLSQAAARANQMVLQASPPPAQQQQLTVRGAIQSPLYADLNPTLEQAVLRIRRVYTPESSNKIYDGKTAEYFQYCDYCHPNDPYSKILDANKVYKFMFYQAFRGQKERGGPRVNNRTVIKFDPEKYREVIKLYETWMLGNTGIQPPEPKKPVQLSTIDQYKAVFRHLHKRQCAQRVTSSVWEQIWTLPLVELHNLVKNRRSSVKRSNYEEKLEAEFAPYSAVDKYDKIEHELWMRGKSNHRSAGTWLRHRYILLHSTSGILRCESIYRAELSDFLGLTLKKKEDPHPLFLMITQLAQGKS